MAEFKYKAKKGPTELIEGVVVAPTKQEAVHLIEGKGLMPIEVVLKIPTAVTPNPGRGVIHHAPAIVQNENKGGMNSAPTAKISSYDLCVFTRQMASFLKSSVPLLNALELIKTQSRKPAIKHLLESLTADVRNGTSFSEALEKYGNKVFDQRYVSMVKAGESGGSLDAVLESLADSLEREEEIQGQIRAGLAYPGLVALVGMGTVFFLITFCLPRLATLFNRTFTTLPLPTKILMALAKPHWQIAVWVITVSIVASVLLLFFGNEKNRKRRDRFVTRLPLLGTVKMKADISRFASMLSMLIENGIPIYQAIETTRPVLANELLKEDLAQAQTRLLKGDTLTAIMKDTKVFPPFVCQMISVGEESGRLSESLKEVSRFYARESLRGIKTITSLLEPLMILGLSLVVGFVVAGIMLPIFDMSWVK